MTSQRTAATARAIALAPVLPSALTQNVVLVSLVVVGLLLLGLVLLPLISAGCGKPI